MCGRSAGMKFSDRETCLAEENEKEAYISRAIVEDILNDFRAFKSLIRHNHNSKLEIIDRELSFLTGKIKELREVFSLAGTPLTTDG